MQFAAITTVMMMMMMKFGDTTVIYDLVTFGNEVCFVSLFEGGRETS